MQYYLNTPHQPESRYGMDIYYISYSFNYLYIILGLQTGLELVDHAHNNVNGSIKNYLCCHVPPIFRK